MFAEISINTGRKKYFMRVKLNERLLIARAKKALKKLSVMQNESLKASFDLLCPYYLKRTIQKPPCGI